MLRSQHARRPSDIAALPHTRLRIRRWSASTHYLPIILQQIASRSLLGKLPISPMQNDASCIKTGLCRYFGTTRGRRARTFSTPACDMISPPDVDWIGSGVVREPNGGACCRFATYDGVSVIRVGEGKPCPRLA